MSLLVALPLTNGSAFSWDGRWRWHGTRIRTAAAVDHVHRKGVRQPEAARMLSLLEVSPVRGGTKLSDIGGPGAGWLFAIVSAALVNAVCGIDVIAICLANNFDSR